MEYIEKLTRQPHDLPVVLNADEIGPIQLVPQAGSGWFPRQTPGRIPAEYQQDFGTTYYLLMLNLYDHPFAEQRAMRIGQQPNGERDMEPPRGQAAHYGHAHGACDRQIGHEDKIP